MTILLNCKSYYQLNDIKIFGPKMQIILKPTNRCNYLLKYIIISYPIGIVGWIFCGASTTWWNCIQSNGWSFQANFPIKVIFIVILGLYYQCLSKVKVIFYYWIYSMTQCSHHHQSVPEKKGLGFTFYQCFLFYFQLLL